MPRWFVDGEQLVVFVANVERQRLGSWRCAWFALRKIDGDLVVALNPCRCARDLTAVDGDGTGVDQVLQPVPSDSGDVRKMA